MSIGGLNPWKYLKSVCKNCILNELQSENSGGVWMRRWAATLWILLSVFLLSGCGSAFKPSASSLYIQKNGSLKEGIVESFEKDYYSKEEFASMVNREVSTYNANYGEDRISVERLEVEDGTMYLTLQYADDETYAGYHEVFCLIGTVEEALGEGLSFDMVFKDSDYEEYTAEEATADRKRSVAVLQEEGLVQLEKPVKYVSNNVEILSSHLVQVMELGDSEEYAYIIY